MAKTDKETRIATLTKAVTFFSDLLRAPLVSKIAIFLSSSSSQSSSQSSSSTVCITCFQDHILYIIIIIITIFSSSSSAVCTICFQDQNIYIIIIIIITFALLNAFPVCYYPIYAAGPKLNLISHWGVDISTKLMALKIYFAVFVKLNLAIFVKLNLAIFVKLNLAIFAKLNLSCCSWSWRLFANWTHSLEPARLLSPLAKLIKLLTKNINWNTIFLQLFLKVFLKK